jgi:hypothetical protein
MHRACLTITLTILGVAAASRASETDRHRGPELGSRRLVVEPQTPFLDPSFDSSFVRVTVLDASGQKLAWAAIDFATGDPSQVVFPYPRAWTNADGIAATVVTRALPGVGDVRTTFTVRSGDTCAGPYPIRDSSVTADGPLGVEAPPLAPFTSVRQRVVGSIGLFANELPIGSSYPGWSMDPRVAEPISVTAGPVLDEEGRRQQLELEVLARRQGATVFIFPGVRPSLYDVVVRGTVACLAGACGPDTSDVLPACDASGNCTTIPADVEPDPTATCLGPKGRDRRNACRLLCDGAIAECRARGKASRRCLVAVRKRCQRRGLSVCG